MTASTLLATNVQRFELAARAIKPLLNRVVFTGRQVVDLLWTARPYPRPVFADDATLHVLSSAVPDRVTAELRHLGLLRVSQRSESDLWAVEETVQLAFSWVSEEDETARPWLAYATLLTVPIGVGEGLTIRVTGAPALLALLWESHRIGKAHAIDSETLEDVVALVAGRAELDREVAAAPADLRAFIAGETTRFLEDESADHVLRSALPDACLLPGLVAPLAERFRRISALA